MWGRFDLTLNEWSDEWLTLDFNSALIRRSFHATSSDLEFLRCSALRYSCFRWSEVKHLILRGRYYLNEEEEDQTDFLKCDQIRLRTAAGLILRRSYYIYRRAGPYTYGKGHLIGALLKRRCRRLWAERIVSSCCSCRLRGLVALCVCDSYGKLNSTFTLIYHSLCSHRALWVAD
jgi:hypothetical protein